MAAPNIVNVTSIIGMTTAVSIGNTNTMNVLISNSSDSSIVLKINTILVSNIDPTETSVDVTVKLFNQASGIGVSHALSNNITVPGKSSIVLLGKDSPIYLTENKSLSVSASAANDIDVICSYEEIS
jgi:uncharacterized membrane protein